jgi:hypothetical protein
VKLPNLNAFAKAQLWGMAVGFALALLATDRLGYGLGLFVVGWLASWLALEFFTAARMPSERKDAAALIIGISSGFATPWGGFLFAALMHALRP